MRGAAWRSTTPCSWRGRGPSGLPCAQFCCLHLCTAPSPPSKLFFFLSSRRFDPNYADDDMDEEADEEAEEMEADAG